MNTLTSHAHYGLSPAVRAAAQFAKAHTPSRWSWAEFLSNIGTTRGRSITLYELDIPLGLFAGTARNEAPPSGLALPSPEGDIIIISTRSDGCQRDMTLAHEVGHLIMDHQPPPGGMTAEMIRKLLRIEDAAFAAQFFRRKQFLERHQYAQAIEADAETFATLFVSGIYSAPRVPPNADAARARLIAVL